MLMTSRLITVAATVLFHLYAFSLDAQITQQTLIQPTPQTRQQLTKALQEYREKKDRHGEALTLLQLGLAEAGLGNVTGARTNLTEAVGKMHAQNDLVGAWMALLVLSQIEVAAGRPAEALPHVERALTTLNEAKTSTAPFSLKTLMALGSVSGLPPEMGQLLEGPSAAAVKSLMIQYSLEPMTHDIFGSVLTEVGQLEKAEAELKAAAAGAIYAQGMYDFSIESHFGDLRSRQQRYDEARTHYVKALNASSTAATMLPMGGGQQIQAGLYDRLVRLETATGHPEEAKRWSQKARELGRKRPESR
jgi:tetratricopeptide (TPR) repeat protein